MDIFDIFYFTFRDILTPKNFLLISPNKIKGFVNVLKKNIKNTIDKQNNNNNSCDVIESDGPGPNADILKS